MHAAVRAGCGHYGDPSMDPGGFAHHQGLLEQPDVLCAMFVTAISAVCIRLSEADVRVALEYQGGRTSLEKQVGC